MVSKQLITYDEVDNMIMELSKCIKTNNITFDRIIGIARGGLNISTKLSEIFEVPHEAIRISFYEGEKFCKDTMTHDMKGVDVMNGSKFILVDDLIDSGATLNHFKSLSGLTQGDDFYVATLHWNPNGEYKQKPDFFVKEKQDSWIVYPWEVVSC